MNTLMNMYINTGEEFWNKNKDLFEAAMILENFVKESTGIEKLHWSNAVGHILARIYGNGYIASEFPYLEFNEETRSWKVPK